MTNVKARHSQFPVNPGQGFANSFQQLMQAVPMEQIDPQTRQNLNTLNDTDVMGGIAGIIDQMSQPVAVSQLECTALKAKVSGMAAQAISKNNQAHYDKDAPFVTKQELLDDMKLDSQEKQEGMLMMRKLTSCVNKGYLSESELNIDLVLSDN